MTQGFNLQKSPKSLGFIYVFIFTGIYPFSSKFDSMKCYDVVIFGFNLCFLKSPAFLWVIFVVVIVVVELGLRRKEDL